MPAELRDDYRQKIVTALSRVDADYATNYAKDVTLIEYLLLHIYPLLKRVAFQLELKNSLIEAVSAQYANQFIVAMRFIEYHPDLSLHQLSRDEIGYIALHFAAHQERENQFSFKKIEKILLVGDFRQSNLILAKSKLLTYFPNAKVLSRTKSALSGLVSGEVDLVLVLDDKDLPPLKAVCVRISEGLSEDDFIRIRNMLLLNQDFLQNKPLRGIADLFFEELFFVEEHTDYEAILSKYATILADRHYADPSYRQSVLEREKRFSTVFENGVAGPHGMDQKALIDSIAVIILKNTAFYRGKPVRLIFMINIKQGHLFIHQEISDCLLKIMGDEALVNRLCQTDKFTEFQMYLERLM
ncbi:putative licABCH operon regulator [bioreactor metagenome]|uniref:Putative licABCH operon regulator n=1 Tax=bioreactor metagenome TaxID=1076179 RepID=A0A645BZR7_9ZZZZ